MTAEQKRAKKAANDFALYSTLAIIIVAILFAGICLGGLLVGKTEVAVPVQAETKVEAAAEAPVEPEPVATPVEKAEPVQEPEVEPIEVAPGMVALGTFKITHYCPCDKCCGEYADGITSTGKTATEGRTIAVDTDVIPYGSQVLIMYEDGTEHIYTAEDTGGGIKKNHIDVFMYDHEAALNAGVKTAEVFLVGGAAQWKLTTATERTRFSAHQVHIAGSTVRRQL